MLGAPQGWEMVSWILTPAHQDLMLGWELWRSPWSLPLEMAPRGLSAWLAHVLSWEQHRASGIDPLRLGLLLEPLLALPQELTWLLFSPPRLIWSHQCGTGPRLGVPAAWPRCQQHGAHPGGQNLELLAVWWLRSARAAQPITIWCPI